MIDDQLPGEIGQHLVDGVLNGHMTRRELLARASVLGLSATALGSLMAACGDSTSARALSAHANADGTLLATSGWVREGIVLQGVPGAWDATIAEISVIEDGGIWKAWYTGANPGVLAAIGYATAPSPCGPWTKYGAGVSPTVLNLLTPGFETDSNSDGIADNWTVATNVAGAPTFSLVTGRTGGKAQRIQYTAQAGDTGRCIYLQQVVDDSVVMYDRVITTVYAKGRVTGGCTVAIDPAIAGSNQEIRQTFAPTNSWAQYRVEVITTAASPTGGVTLRIIRVAFASDSGSVDITIDDAALTKFSSGSTNPVRLGRDHGSVFKIGATYHMWAVSDGTVFHHCTSTDGLTWGADDTALSGGTWDPLIANPCVWRDGSGAWYLFYEGYRNDVANAGIGVATASTPKGPWTKYGNGPIVGGPGIFEACRPWVLKVDDTCYMWFHGGHVTRLPDDICRAHAAGPLGPWTVDASPLLARTGYDEGEGLPRSQLADVRVLANGVEGYMLYTANRNEDPAVAPSYIKLVTRSQ